MDPVPTPPLIVKVGGSLLPSREGYRLVAEALAPILDQGPTWVVVSAAKGVTDALHAAIAGQEDPDAVLRLHERLFAGPLPQHLLGWFRTARAAAQAGSPEALLAWGEQASAELLRTQLADLGHDLAVVELEPSASPPMARRAIVPGFYVRGAEGAIQVLPRGGSDISAVMAARWVGAPEVRLWKEGGGIRLQPGVTVDRVDAQTLVHWLGDRVRPMHPAAVRLAAQAGIGLLLEDPWGADGSTRIVPVPLVGQTAAPMAGTPVTDRVAGSATL